ncbi:hypothetical protein OnM2_075012 [Erysiphe neolycopersici]|uniref:Uncharacterized protein n=1 Tax=Erysiphe neolycopersici TaxID=212602 RepID=A0A420HIW3_9PEZI|nr:hypothetical protein OnM2_075012 [Erysiphe neolycopersici]
MIFNDNCSRAGVAQENFTKVFPTMLKGLAFDFYYANISSIPKTFDDICKLFRDYFEGEEYKRVVLENWNNYANKSTIKCLQLIVSELRILYKGLSIELQTEKFLYSKIVTAC